MNNYWIGGVSPGGETWDWIDGTEMALGVPFWGRVSQSGPSEGWVAVFKEVLGQLRPGKLRPGQLRPGQTRPCTISYQDNLSVY